MRRTPVLALAIVILLAVPGAAHAACARPAPEFPIATITTEGTRIPVGAATSIYVGAGGQWAEFSRAVRVTAISAATGERVDLGTASASPPVAVRFTPDKPGIWTFEAAWEEAVCLSDDQTQITEWRTRSTAGGRLESVPAPSRTPKVSLSAYAKARPGGARIAAGVVLLLDCRGRIADRPVGIAETVVRWTTDGRAPTTASRALRARAPSCTEDAGGLKSAGLAEFEARQTKVGAYLSSPGEQGLALPGGAFPRPGPVVRAWLELRLGGTVLVATRARLTQRVVRARFCAARGCTVKRHVQTDVRPDAGPCPGMPGDRCRTFSRRIVGG